jgi:hypothetical protein
VGRRLNGQHSITVVDERGFNEGAIIAAGQAFADTLASQTSPTSVDTDEKEIERLRSKGCDYKRARKDWRFKLRAYEGGQNYVGEDTLFRHAARTAKRTTRSACGGRTTRTTASRSSTSCPSTSSARTSSAARRMR